ncbi:hypothetical protein GCM10010376_51100 [Streptomyces violaceusniger]
MVITSTAGTSAMSRVIRSKSGVGGCAALASLMVVGAHFLMDGVPQPRRPPGAVRTGRVSSQEQEGREGREGLEGREKWGPGEPTGGTRGTANAGDTAGEHPVRVLVS